LQGRGNAGDHAITDPSACGVISCSAPFIVNPPVSSNSDTHHPKTDFQVWDNLWDKFPHNLLEAAYLLALRPYNLLM